MDATTSGARLETGFGSPRATGDDAHALNWWERRWGIVLLLVLAALPLLWPTVPPLGDLPGHIGRYRVELEITKAPALQQFYSFHWRVMGNLGVDLLVVPLSKIVALEMAVKLIVIAIPVLTVGGFLWVAHEVHGRIPAATIFALPLAYNYPFLFGFANFSLSMAFCFLAFALWLRLGRRERYLLRAALFVPLSLLVWITHVYGWATLSAMAFVAEWSRLHRRGAGALGAAMRAAVLCLPLVPPVPAMLLWRTDGASGFTGDWFDVGQKAKYLVMALRDQWMAFDLASLAVLLALIGVAARRRRLAYAPEIALVAPMLLALFVLLPRVVFGSSYADMRMVPYVYAAALIAIRPNVAGDARFVGRLALAATAFLLIRTAGNTVSLWLYDRSYHRELAALDHLPKGAKLVSFVGRSCGLVWWVTKLEHLPGLALERNLAFSNDQWDMAGGQPLAVRYSAAGAYGRDPSQIVVPKDCANERLRPIDQALRGFPRQAFDYVWLIRPPAYSAADAEGLEPVWRSGTSVLYRVADRRQPESIPGSSR